MKLHQEVLGRAQRSLLPVKLADMLGFYRAKYGVKDVGHVLVALSYFDDADRERLPTLLRRWDWSNIKATIRRWVADATRGR